jgi:hypothetical protein
MVDNRTARKPKIRNICLPEIAFIFIFDPRPMSASGEELVANSPASIASTAALSSASNERLDSRKGGRAPGRYQVVSRFENNPE